MIGRAKNHPNKTKGMEDAIKIFNEWIKDYKKRKIKFFLPYLIKNYIIL